MLVFSNKVIPIDAMLKGEKPDVPKIISNAKSYPWHFAGELFALAMMIIGAYAFIKWTYDLGRMIGSSL